MEALLVRANLFSFVDDNEIDLGTNLALQDAWKNKDVQAQCELIMNNGDREVQCVKTLKTSKEIWDKLKATYQQIDVAIQVTSYTKLIEIHMAENTNVIEFLNEFQCLVDDVVVTDLDIPKPQLVILLFKGLPFFMVCFHHHNKEIKST